MEKYFTMTDEHIKLINNMWVSWNDMYFGSPTINQKRPYGNSSVISDMYCILEGKELDEDELNEHGIDYGEFVDGLRHKYLKLHKETETALQIILHTKTFEVGDYKRIGFGKEWVKLNNKRGEY